MDKEFDFVINLIIHEPINQVIYEIKLTVNCEKEKKQEAVQPAKETNSYILITSDGGVKDVSLLTKP